MRFGDHFGGLVQPAIRQSSPAIARRRPGLAAAAGGLAVIVAAFLSSACGVPGTSSGPTCAEFLPMNRADKESAVLEWMADHDSRFDAGSPRAGLSGMALFQNGASFIAYCNVQGRGDDRLGDLRPSG